VPFGRQTAPFQAALQLPLRDAVHSTHRVEPQSNPPAQSESKRHCTQTWGWSAVLQIGVGGAHAPGPSHGSDRHDPSDPSRALQYLPALQLSAPFVTRQPAWQAPVEIVEVSQTLSGLQSPSFKQPQTAWLAMHAGVEGFPAQTLSFVDEHIPQAPASAAPAGWQAGRVLGHANGPGFSAE